MNFVSRIVTYKIQALLTIIFPAQILDHLLNSVGIIFNFSYLLLVLTSRYTRNKHSNMRSI